MTERFDHTSDVAKARRAAAPASYARYQYPPDVPLAIRVAQATRRPLLLLGEPGCGKSTLARDVALCLGYAYFEEVITSRTTARDLLWRFDHVRRLGDASIDKDRAENLRHYLEPGPLWWAIDPASAKRRGADADAPVAKPPVADANTTARLNRGSNTGSVLLLDEIDKADPDVPNDMLVPLGELRFELDDPPTEVRIPEDRELLVFLTSNGERDLPPAFQRRCIPVTLGRPDALMKQIVAAHATGISDEMLTEILTAAGSAPAGTTGLRSPGTAEIIDTARACASEGVDTIKHEAWQRIVGLTLWKQLDPVRAEVPPK